MITLQVSHLFIISQDERSPQPYFSVSLSEIAFLYFYCDLMKKQPKLFQAEDKGSPPSVLGELDWLWFLYPHLLLAGYIFTLMCCTVYSWVFLVNKPSITFLFDTVFLFLYYGILLSFEQLNATRSHSRTWVYLS